MRRVCRPPSRSSGSTICDRCALSNALLPTRQSRAEPAIASLCDCTSGFALLSNAARPRPRRTTPKLSQARVPLPRMQTSTSTGVSTVSVCASAAVPSHVYKPCLHARSHPYSSMRRVSCVHGQPHRWGGPLATIARAINCQSAARTSPANERHSGAGSTDRVRMGPEASAERPGGVGSGSTGAACHAMPSPIDGRLPSAAL